MMALHFLLVVLAAGSINRERERGTFDLLIPTQLTSWEIVIGNFHGVLSAVLPTVLLVLCTLTFGVFTGAFLPGFALRYALVLASFTLMTGAGAMLISVVSQRSASAILLALVAPVLLWSGFLSLFEQAWSTNQVDPLRFATFHGVFVIVWLAVLRTERISQIAALGLTIQVPMLFASIAVYVAVGFFHQLHEFKPQFIFCYFYWIAELEGEYDSEFTIRRHANGWSQYLDTLDPHSTPFIIAQLAATLFLLLLAVVYLTKDLRPSRRQFRRLPSSVPVSVETPLPPPSFPPSQAIGT
jgi:hypothetical protein